MKRASDPPPSSAWSAGSTPSRLASKAAIHKIAGPSRASRLRSGPSANGMTATRIRKNTIPTDAPPPMRRAMRHSRTNRASAGVTSRRRFRCGPEPQLLRAVQSDRRVSGGDEDPAAFEMGLHDSGKRGLSAGVERGHRLHELPERAPNEKEGRESG